MRIIRSKSKTIAKKKLDWSPLTVIMLIVLVAYSLTILFSLYWAIISSFKINNTVFKYDMFGLPRYNHYKSLADSLSLSDKRVAQNVIMAEKDGGALFYTYRNVWNYLKVGVTTNSGATKDVYVPEMYLNSFLYAFGCAVTNTVVPCVTAYLCARYTYKFSKIVYTVVIVVMIIPIIGSMPSEISLVQSLGLMGTYYGVWIMKANFLGLYFLVFYEGFKAMPNSFSEAATIDGASDAQIMMQIAMPLMRNTILTIFLIKFVEFWNDYQTPMVYMSPHPTISYGLNLMINSNLPSSGTAFNPAHIPARMAAVVYTALPVAVLFMVFQNKLMGNLTVGGVKG